MTDENTLSRHADKLKDLQAAVTFLEWCKVNGRPTDLGIEWLIACAKTVAE